MKRVMLQRSAITKISWIDRKTFKYECCKQSNKHIKCLSGFSGLSNPNFDTQTQNLP